MQHRETPKVLGRSLAAPFDAFWKQVEAEIAVPVEYIEEGHSLVFGDKGADLSAPQLPEWASLPDDDFAYHVARELGMVVLRQRGYPRTVRGKHYPESSAEARIGGDIQEMVLNRSLDALLEPFGFNNSFIQRRMLNGTLRGLSNSPVPEWGSPWFFTWAIRYCELHFEFGPEDWKRVEAIYSERSPAIRSLGEELAGIMREVGWDTREQALEVMIRIRDTLGLKVDERVLVIDPPSGKIF
jgi:hypothetical protein